MLRNLLKRLLRVLLVGENESAVRFGSCRGLLLPKSVATKNLAMLLGRYELSNQESVASLSRGCKVAYDVGAHVGFFTLLLHRFLVPGAVVHSFEPSGLERESLEEIVEINGLQSAVKVHPWAIADEVGELQFFAGDSSFTGILAETREAQKRTDGNPITVPAKTIDSLVYDLGLPVPEFLKIDVESAESAVIRGARRVLKEHRPKLFVEMHGPTACAETLTELLNLDYDLQVVDSASTRITTPDQLRDRFGEGAWTLHVAAVPKRQSRS